MRKNNLYGNCVVFDPDGREVFRAGENKRRWYLDRDLAEELNDNNIRLNFYPKGATPAGLGQCGIIPGSMTEPGYVVEGLANEASLASASHGAGRVMSRKIAKESITMSTVKKQIRDAGVTLIGSGLDEAHDAYKDIDRVIQSQSDLVKVRARFTPKIVRMDGDPTVLRGAEEQPGM